MAAGMLPKGGKGDLFLFCDRKAKQANSLIRARAIVRFFAATFGVFLGVMLFDSWLRREDWFIRWSLPIVAALGIGYFLYRWVIPAFRFSARAMDVAHWMESRRPEFSDGMTTAIELSQMDPKDTRYGSQQLRDKAYYQWLATHSPESVGASIQWSAIRGTLLSAFSIVAAAIGFASFWPENFQLSARRLLLPWASERWPQVDQLRIVNLPGAAGFGSILELEIIDLQPPLPMNVAIQLRRDQEELSSVLSIDARLENDRAWVSLPPLQGDVQVRAVGGVDQSAAWETVKVVELPQWSKYEFEITPPDYLSSLGSLEANTDTPLGRLRGNITLSGQSIEVIAGSRIRFRGELDRPVRSVRPILRNGARSSSTLQPQGNQEDLSSREDLQAPWTARLNESGKKLALEDSSGNPLLLTESVEWVFQFELEDQILLNSTNPWRIEVMPDEPPEAFLESRGLSSFSANAALDVVGAARDDWRLSELKVKASLEASPDNEVEWLVEWKGDLQEYRLESEFQLAPAFESLGVELKPQDRISVWLEARDDLGQVGKSQIQTWTVESSQKQLELITEQSMEVTELLRDLASSQETGLRLVREIRERWSEPTVDQSQLDAMSAVVQLQQRLSSQLEDSEESLGQKIDENLQLLARNQLQESDLGRDLEQLLQMLSGSHAELVDAARRDSLRAQSALRESFDRGDRPEKGKESLKELQDSQMQSLNALSELMELLSSRQSLAQFRQELVRLEQQQEVVLENTSEVHFAGLQNRSATEQKELLGLSKSQLELAVGVEEWFLRARENLQESPGQQDPNQASLVEAVQILTQQQASGEMKTAGRRIEEGQLTQAMDHQRDVLDALERAIEALKQNELENFAREQQLPKGSAPVDQEKQPSDQLARLVLDLEEIIRRQLELMPDYRTLADQWNTPDPRSKSDELAQRLMTQQDSVRQQVDALPIPAELPVYRWALNQIEADLGKAIAATRRRRVDPDAIQAANDAVNQLMAARDSMEAASQDTDPDSGGDEPQPRDPSGSPDPSQPEAGTLASLKLIRALQLDLKRRTSELDEIQDQGRRSSRLLDLTQQQDELTGHLDRLLQAWESRSGGVQEGLQ
jgi:hypothetical protein